MSSAEVQEQRRWQALGNAMATVQGLHDTERLQAVKMETFTSDVDQIAPVLEALAGVVATQQETIGKLETTIEELTKSKAVEVRPGEATTKKQTHRKGRRE